MSDVRCDEVNVVDYRVKSLLRFPASNIRDNRQSFPRRVPHALFHLCVCIRTRIRTSHASFYSRHRAMMEKQYRVIYERWPVLITRLIEIVR